ncbi:hypothetical protein IWX50DRAFT_618232 [Phyllosticta citricarpa]
MTGPSFCFPCSFCACIMLAPCLPFRGVHGSENREATNIMAPLAVAKCAANGPTRGRLACLPDMRSSQRSPASLSTAVRSSRRHLSFFDRAGSRPWAPAAQSSRPDMPSLPSPAQHRVLWLRSATRLQGSVSGFMDSGSMAAPGPGFCSSGGGGGGGGGGGVDGSPRTRVDSAAADRVMVRDRVKVKDRHRSRDKGSGRAELLACCVRETRVPHRATSSPFVVLFHGQAKKIACRIVYSAMCQQHAAWRLRIGGEQPSNRLLPSLPRRWR